MTPYYEHAGITIYHGNAVEIAPTIGGHNVVATDPPYPNNAGHYDDDITDARRVLIGLARSTPRMFIFWAQLECPSVGMPCVARHIWHRTNTNRPDNYEAIYEFALEAERSSRVFPHAVVYEGLTGCREATGHPTQKPERLMRELIGLRGDTRVVLDPFMGSGTTLAAAKRAGIVAIGIEREEKYCEIAAKRLQQEALPLEMPA